MTRHVSPLAVARCRVRQLERCLDDLGRSLDLRAVNCSPRAATRTRTSIGSSRSSPAGSDGRFGKVRHHSPPPEADASAGINHNLNQG